MSRVRLGNRIAVGGYTASPLDLAVVRVIVGLAILAMAVPHGYSLAEAPAMLFSPPIGSPSLVPTPPGLTLLNFVNAATVVSASLLLLGAFTTVASLATTASMLTLYSIGYTTGKINHNILLVLLPAFLAFSGWGRCLSVRNRSVADPRTPEHQPSLAPWALVIALTMAYAGIGKLVTGWLDLDTQSSLGNLAQNHFISERHTLLRGWLIAGGAGWFHELVDWLTVIFELSLIPALFAPSLFRALLVVATAFHFAVLLMFGISFETNILAYSVFAPMACLIPRSFKPSLLVQGVGGIAVILLAALVYSGREPLVVRFGIPIQPAIVVGGFVLAVAFSVASARRGVARTFQFERDEGTPVIYFDGVCGLCNRWVDFVLRHDKERRFRFATLQSSLAAARLRREQIDPERLDSIVVATETAVLCRSDAVLAVLLGLGYPRWLICCAAAVPSAIRDLAYRLVASVRYRAFGKLPTCRVPTAQERELFLSD